MHLAQKRKEEERTERKEKRKRKSEEKWNTFRRRWKQLKIGAEQRRRNRRVAGNAADRRARTTNPGRVSGIRVAARFQRRRGCPREQLANSPDVAGFEVCG